MSEKKVVFDWDTFGKFIDEFKNETDRAAVILGAAKLDSILAQLLDRYFLPSLSSIDELLEGDSPLSSYSARINICYRLGLISADYAKALHAVRKIRNTFAHEVFGVSLSSGSHADRLRSLLLPFIPAPVFRTFRKHFFGEEDNPSTNFRACLAMMAARLEMRLYQTDQLVGESAWPLIPNSTNQEEIAS